MPMRVCYFLRLARMWNEVDQREGGGLRAAQDGGDGNKETDSDELAH